ncbi:MAG: S-layer homology domain-containing protein [Firmicutes bacterium]|nr:S-layer homology domain-containing protein [Bacillota bacterium]
MTTKRTFLTLFLALILVVSAAVPAFAAGEAELKVTVPSGSYAAGDTFDVTLEVSNNPGVSAVMISLEFDKSSLQCTSITPGVALANMVAVDNPDQAKIGAASADNQADNGVIATFTFKTLKAVKDPAFSLCVSEFDKVEADGLSYSTVAYTVLGAGETQTPVDGQSGQGEQGGQQGGEGSGQETPVQTISFTDTKGNWAETYIIRSAELGLFKGNTDGSFRPTADVTRAAFVTVLYRLAGSPAVTATTPFTDISTQNAEFQKAIAWAYNNGYINGKTATTFGPTAPIKRQEAMKILYFYAGGQSGFEILLYDEYDKRFTDHDKLASWAKAPMYWGIYNEIISGSTTTTLNPQGTANRAQLAKILVNFVDNYNKQ